MLPMRATWRAGITAEAFRWNVSIRVAGPDRAGLERLLRYCARPPFALERLEQMADNALIYRFDKVQPDGRTQLRHTPLELTERLALIPPPRIHRHGYHAVLD
jgi:putative transposase